MKQQVLFFCILTFGLQIEAAQGHPCLASGFFIRLEQEVRREKPDQDVIKNLEFEEYVDVEASKGNGIIENDNQRQDVSFLNLLIQSSEMVENQVEIENRFYGVHNLDKIVQENLTARQSKFEMKIYKAARKRVLDEQRISLSDFKNMNDEERTAFLIQAARNNAKQLYDQISNENQIAIDSDNQIHDDSNNEFDDTETAVDSDSEFDKTVIFEPLKKRLKKGEGLFSKKFNAHLYSHAIELVLQQNNLSVEAFNILSNFRKKTLLLKLNKSDRVTLPESEQSGLAELQLQRNLMNYNLYQSRKRRNHKH